MPFLLLSFLSSFFGEKELFLKHTNTHHFRPYRASEREWDDVEISNETIHVNLSVDGMSETHTQSIVSSGWFKMMMMHAESAIGLG